MRVHPILTRGGDFVNVVPETAALETLDAIEDVEEKQTDLFAMERCIGERVTIETMQVYLPTCPQKTPNENFTAVYEVVEPKKHILRIGIGTAAGLRLWEMYSI